MAFENYSIEQFMNAWFKKDYSVIDEKEFQTVYSEYIDVSGLYETDEFEKVSYIHYLNNRKNVMKLLIEFQKKYLSELLIPYQDQSVFNKYGYFLKWNGSIDNFLKQLKKIEISEARFSSQLEIKIKELEEFRQKKGKSKKEQTLEEARKSFIRMLISLRKMDYKIDNKTTSVEELALIIRLQCEQADIK